MAELLQLVVGNDLVADLSTTSLLAATGATTFVQRNGWIPKVGPFSLVQSPNIVTEVLTITLKGTSKDSLATAARTLEGILWRITRYMDSVAEKYAVILRDQLAGETYSRQAFVTGFSWDAGEEYHHGRFVQRDWQLGIDRTTPWESPYSVEIGLTCFMSKGLATSGQSEICGTMPGDSTDLLYTLGYTPAEGTTVSLFYIDGTVKEATCTFVGHGELNYIMNGADLIATLTGTSLEVLGEANSGKADPGTGVTIYYQISTVSALGGVLPGRIARFKVMGNPGGGTVEEMWLGFRTVRFGSLANFVATLPWEAEKGTVGIETVKTTDAGCTPGSGNTKIQCQYTAHADDHLRLTLSAYDLAVGNSEDLRGTFDIIARVSVGSGVTAVLHLDNGYLEGATFHTAEVGQRVTITNTAKKYVNLGRITWPPTGRVTPNLTLVRYAALALYAERTAGSTANWLDVDHFIPIPVNEGYGHFSSMSVVYNTMMASVYCDALGNVVGLAPSYSAGYVYGYISTLGTTLPTWHLPVEEMAVVAAMQTASPALTDVCTLEFKVFPRYPSLRGSG